MIASVILAGGKSSRMGANKAILPYKGARLIDYIADTMKAINLPVYVSGHIQSFSCIPDTIANLGPLGGIISSVDFLLSQKIHAAIFVPVDMPFINNIVLSSLINVRKNEDAIFYQDNPLPLFLYFSTRVLTILAEFKAHNYQERSIGGFINKLNFHQCVPDSAETIALTNTNTPEQWQKIQESNPNVVC